MEQDIFKREFFWEMGAETVLINYNRNKTTTDSLGFCPVIREACRTDCICFTKAAVKRYNMCGGKSTYRIYPAYCNNPMLSGERFPQT